MILHPSILALLIGSLLVTSMLFYASYHGVRIIRHWDIQSGSELQLALEKRTYLISTLMAYALGFQLISLFIFIFTADALSSLFVGAMCAAGTLKVNAWGYPTILLKVFNFLFAGLWLILNHADNRAEDYPLVKTKYAALLFLAPFIVAETIVQGSYFLNMEPAVITSCCGTLFTSDAGGVTAGIVTLPRAPVEVAFYSTMGLTLFLGLLFWLRGKGGVLFSLSCSITFVVSVVALISFICLYFYELPTHHCPFCILQKEYGYIGYAIYVAFFGGSLCGLGVGVLMPFREVTSLKTILPPIQRRLASISIASYAVFMGIVLCGVAFSNLTLHGS